MSGYYVMLSVDVYALGVGCLISYLEDRDATGDEIAAALAWPLRILAPIADLVLRPLLGVAAPSGEAP